MKQQKYILLLVIALIMLTGKGFAQDCVEYHKVGDCMMDKQKGFKTYSQSKSVSLSLMDTIDINVIFYGQKDYILSFCAHRKMYPVHFLLKDPDTGQILYDNARDKYIESLGVGFDVTKSLNISIDVLARKATEEEIENFIGCLGMLIQYKNYENKTVNMKIQ